MKKNLVLIGVFAAMLVVALVAWLWGNPRSSVPISITSDDGVITLQIPTGSLPKGLKPADISVRPLEARTFWGSEGEVPGGVYELLPDGIVFTQPVTLRVVTLGTSSGTIPQILHVASGTTELLNPSAVRIDQSNKSIETEFAINHFSSIGIDPRHGTFTYELNSGGAAAVGQSLPFVFTIRAEERSHWFQRGVGYWPDQKERARALRSPRDRASVREEEPGGYSYRVAPGTSYIVAASEVRAVSVAANVLTPERVPTPQKEQKNYEPYQFATEFICRNPGQAYVHFDTKINYRMYRGHEDINGREMPNRLGTYLNEEIPIYIHSEPYQCTGAPVVEKKEEPPRAAPPTTQTPPASTSATPSPAPKPSGAVMTVCGLPGGPACPKR